ncbi:aminotransferase class I/II-fold pyridoxal phosphate-dependent enzyme, partial [Candidatus Calescamantes bacterium]|nr:aminotransferase class I/II-fold pyridoxal phosphate-dependent enzyme [Candidatus Calescamantes bacterium]
MKINYSKRIKKIPPYLFAELDIAKKKVLASGKRVFDFGVGDPDMPTFESVLASVKKHINDPATHRYPSYIGSETYRRAAADYISKRFQVEVDPANEVISLIGSKEGIAHFPLAFVDPGDKVFIPEPGYPVYRDGTIFAGG